jgi:predicted metalloprotease
MMRFARVVATAAAVGLTTALAMVRLASADPLNIDPATEDPHGYFDKWLVSPNGNRPELDRFWTAMLPNGYKYSAPGVAWMNEQGGTDAGLCGTIQGTDVLDYGAFYCDKSNTLWFDLTFMNVEIYQNYGWDGVAAVEAHEWGHHIQKLMGQEYRGEFSELQADCYAGGYMHWYAEDGMAHPGFSEGKLAQQFYAAGDESADDADHGTGQMRTEAFSIGWDTIGAPSTISHLLAACSYPYAR